MKRFLLSLACMAIMSVSGFSQTVEYILTIQDIIDKQSTQFPVPLGVFEYHSASGLLTTVNNDSPKGSVFSVVSLVTNEVDFNKIRGFAYHLDPVQLRDHLVLWFRLEVADDLAAELGNAVFEYCIDVTDDDIFKDSVDCLTGNPNVLFIIANEDRDFKIITANSFFDVAKNSRTVKEAREIIRKKYANKNGDDFMAAVAELKNKYQLTVNLDEE